MQEALANEFRQKYLDQNGLGMFQDESQEQLKDVRADNGILLSSYGWTFLKNQLTPHDKLTMHKSVKALEIQKGVYKRRPNAAMIREAHDNYDGATAISILGDFTFARDICEHGEVYGWQYANTNLAAYSWKQLRQGGSIAFYKLGAGRIPYPLEMLWLCLGMIYAMLFGWSSTHNLAWLKLEVIPVALDRYATNGALWGWVRGSWFVTNGICQSIIILKKIYPRSFEHYFGPAHVFARMAKVKWSA